MIKITNNKALNYNNKGNYFPQTFFKRSHWNEIVYYKLPIINYAPVIININSI